MDIIYLNKEEWDSMIREYRDNQLQQLRENPDMDMPIFISRKDYKINWNPKS